MRIGIDATALPAQLYGAGNYIVQLVQALLRFDAGNDYVVFSKPSHAALFDSTRARIVQPRLSSRFARIAWEQTALPLLARQHRLDLLHSPHYTIPLAKTCRAVVTFHDLTFFLYPELHQWYKRLYFPAMMRAAARRADALIAVSENTRADIQRLLQPAARVTTIPYGIDPTFAPVRDSSALDRIRQKYHLPQRFILYVGNLEPRKNLPSLIRAFGRVSETEPLLHLVLAGSRGWQDTDVFSTAQTLGLEKRVLFPGFVPPADLPALYSAASLFVYPSLYEGFGLPVLEAMACGTPVITSNVSSMPEITGAAAILIDPRDKRELGDALQRLLTDEPLRDKLAREGLARAKEFSWERAAKETLAVYAKSCES